MKKMHYSGKLLLATSAAVVMTTSAFAAVDNFDSYPNNQNLIGSGNGQISYEAPNLYFSTLVAPSTLTASNVDSRSPSNSMRFTGPDATSFGFAAALDPSQAVDLTANGTNTHVSFDFKSLDGFNGRVTLQMFPNYSYNANRQIEDYIGTDHWAVLTDSGLSYVDAQHVILGNTTDRWQPNEWYHFDLSITSTSTGPGTINVDQTMTLTRLSDNFVLNTVTAPGLSNGIRTWLTGYTFGLSSNLNEDIVIDNFQIGGQVPEPSSLGLLCLGGAALLRRRK